MTPEEFQQIQKHNHTIMAQVTDLEEKAFLHITEPQIFNPLIEQIENLQNQYIKYKN